MRARKARRARSEEDIPRPCGRRCGGARGGRGGGRNTAGGGGWQVGGAESTRLGGDDGWRVGRATDRRGAGRGGQESGGRAGGACGRGLQAARAGLAGGDRFQGRGSGRWACGPGWPGATARRWPGLVVQGGRGPLPGNGRGGDPRSAGVCCPEAARLVVQSRPGSVARGVDGDYGPGASRACDNGNPSGRGVATFPRVLAVVVQSVGRSCTECWPLWDGSLAVVVRPQAGGWGVGLGVKTPRRGFSRVLRTAWSLLTTPRGAAPATQTAALASQTRRGPLLGVWLACGRPCGEHTSPRSHAGSQVGNTNPCPATCLPGS
ncbi:hypothetical protein HNR67_002281 [Crossiella cryophila]|uniref:Uncharacterized protein n=1 Tax=Crossiella cryophila TaxID=43355 RepID=A0A7W7FT84_9PSEU|nr:hypothetical protein [Crossiella cryophila]